jgi:hypothetical protein
MRARRGGLLQFVLGLVVLYLESLQVFAEPTQNVISQSVVFDAIIEINPPSLNQYVCLFSRYWVTADAYKITVLWAEPNFSRMWFPIYPPGLSITSDTNVFLVNHQISKNHHAVYQRPFQSTKIFKYMYGDYVVDELRNLDQFSDQTSIYVTDLDQDFALQQKKDFKIKVDDSRRLVGMLEGCSSNGLLKSLTIFDKSGSQIQSIRNDYGGENGKQLLAQCISLAEREMTVGLQNGSVNIKLNGANYSYSNFPATYLHGGREITVNYGPIKLGSHIKNLPLRIESHVVGSNEFVSRILFTNYHASSFSNSVLDDLTQTEKQIHKMYTNYSCVAPEKIPEGDQAKIKDLISVLSAPVSDSSLGKESRRLNYLIHLHRLMGATGQTVKTYSELLGKWKLVSEELLMNGGYDQVGIIPKLTLCSSAC